MAFKKELFVKFSDQIDGVVHLADKSQLKPSGIGSVRLKLSGLADYILSDVLYVPQLKRNLISIVQIRQQDHSIHMFHGIIEIRRSYDNLIVMTGVEDNKLLKLNGISSNIIVIYLPTCYGMLDLVILIMTVSVL